MYMYGANPRPQCPELRVFLSLNTGPICRSQANRQPERTVAIMRRVPCPSRPQIPPGAAQRRSGTLCCTTCTGQCKERANGDAASRECLPLNATSQRPSNGLAAATPHRTPGAFINRYCGTYMQARTPTFRRSAGLKQLRFVAYPPATVVSAPVRDSAPGRLPLILLPKV